MNCGRVFKGNVTNNNRQKPSTSISLPSPLSLRDVMGVLPKAHTNKNTAIHDPHDTNSKKSNVGAQKSILCLVLSSTSLCRIVGVQLTETSFTFVRESKLKHIVASRHFLLNEPCMRVLILLSVKFTRSLPRHPSIKQNLRDLWLLSSCSSSTSVVGVVVTQ